jgi:ribosome biogenesis protein UTP30
MQEQREEKELLGEQEEKVFLVVGLKQAPKREVHKPVRLYVTPHASLKSGGY